MPQRRTNSERKTLKSRKGSALIKMKLINCKATANFSKSFKIGYQLDRVSMRGKEPRSEIRAMVTMIEIVLPKDRIISGKEIKIH